MESADLRDYLEATLTFPRGWSDDARRVLVVSNLPGTFQLFEADGSQPVQLTAEAEPVDGRYVPTRGRVLVTRDTGGDERHQLFLLGEGGGLDPLVVEPDWMHLPGGFAPGGSLLAYACNRRNGRDFDVYVLDIDTGDDRCVFAPGSWCTASSFSPDGRSLIVGSRSGHVSMDNDVYVVDVEGNGEPVLASAHDGDAQFTSHVWLADSSGFYVATDAGRDVRSVALWSRDTGRYEYVIDTEWDVDISGDKAGTRLAVIHNEDGYSRVEVRDAVTLDVVGEVPLPGRGVVVSVHFARDGSKLAFHYTSPTVPGDVWSYDCTTGATERLTNGRCAIDPAALVEPELHRFSSFDGESVPVFLYRPRAAGDAPVVVIVHGGPESQSFPSWNPLIPYLVARGYAVAVPNVRGSTGYGKRYHHLDDKRKRLDSVRDLASLHAWLAGQGGVDASRAALYGGSYGGYMVLAGLTMQPELWAAGVDIVGISSLVTFLENTSVWRRSFREREYGTLDEDRDFLHEASPLTHIDALRAPLFIIHGANDPRVPLSEAEQIHATLSRKGVATSLLVYEDEGHGLSKLANRLDAYPQAMAFLDDVLRPAG